jgi:hypothetical protein
MTGSNIDTMTRDFDLQPTISLTEGMKALGYWFWV